MLIWFGANNKLLTFSMQLATVKTWFRLKIVAPQTWVFVGITMPTNPGNSPTFELLPPDKADACHTARQNSKVFGRNIFSKNKKLVKRKISIVCFKRCRATKSKFTIMGYFYSTQKWLQLPKNNWKKPNDNKLKSLISKLIHLSQLAWSGLTFSEPKSLNYLIS